MHLLANIRNAHIYVLWCSTPLQWILKVKPKGMLTVAAQQKHEQVLNSVHDNLIAALYSSRWTWTVDIGGNLGYTIPNPLTLLYTQTSDSRMKLCPKAPGPACVRVLPFAVTGSLHLYGFLKSLSQWREVPEGNFLVVHQPPFCRPLCGSVALKCALTPHRARVTCHAYFLKMLICLLSVSLISIKLPSSLGGNCLRCDYEAEALFWMLPCALPSALLDSKLKDCQLGESNFAIYFRCVLHS